MLLSIPYNLKRILNFKDSIFLRFHLISIERSTQLSIVLTENKSQN